MKASDIIKELVKNKVLRVDERFDSLLKRIDQMPKSGARIGGGGGAEVIVSPVEPKNKKVGMLWLDTSV